MKQKKALWFIKNKLWLFYVILFILIIVANFLYDRGKMLIKWGFTWLTFVGFLFLLLLFLVLLGILYFFIYYEDSASLKIKKRIRTYDWIIEKFIDKES